LPAADESGKSDPYVQIADCEKEYRTRVIYDSVNPIFFQCIECLYEVNPSKNKDEKEALAEELGELPPIVCDVYDQDEDLIGTSCDFLARAEIVI